MENLYGRLEELLPLPLCCCEHNDLVANFMLEYPVHDDGVPATCQNDDYGATLDSLGLPLPVQGRGRLVQHQDVLHLHAPARGAGDRVPLSAGSQIQFQQWGSNRVSHTA